MKRDDGERLRDILSACDAIDAYSARGLRDGMAFDAVRMRIIEISEAVKDISLETLAHEPIIPWTDVARMRDHLAHHYFDSSRSIVEATVEEDLPVIRSAVERMLSRAASL